MGIAKKREMGIEDPRMKGWEEHWKAHEDELVAEKGDAAIAKQKGYESLEEAKKAHEE